MKIKLGISLDVREGSRTMAIGIIKAVAIFLPIPLKSWLSFDWTITEVEVLSIEDDNERLINGK